MPGFSGQIAGTPAEPSVENKARVTSGSADYNCLGTPMHAVASGTRCQSGMGQLGGAGRPTQSGLLLRDRKPKVAILREEGSNGDREMTSALFNAGFEPWSA